MIRKENFFRSASAILRLHWGRQISLDLVIGILLFHVFVYWREGSWLVTATWFVASIVFGNLTTLFYFVLHFEAIARLFGR